MSYFIPSKETDISDHINQLSKFIEYFLQVRSLCGDATITYTPEDGILCFSKSLSKECDKVSLIERATTIYSNDGERLNKVVYQYAYVYKFYDVSSPITDGISIFGKPIVQLYSYCLIKDTKEISNFCIAPYVEVIKRNFDAHSKIIAECNKDVLDFICENKNIDLSNVPDNIKRLLPFS